MEFFTQSTKDYLSIVIPITLIGVVVFGVVVLYFLV